MVTFHMSQQHNHVPQKDIEGLRAIISYSIRIMNDKLHFYFFILFYF